MTEPSKEALETAHAVWESRPANVGWPIGECEKAIAVALDAFAQQATEVRERELLRKLEALQMRLAPIEEARQQACDAALDGRILGFRIEREGPSPTGLFYVTSPDLPGLLLSETTEIDEMAVRNAIIDLLYVERALKSTAQMRLAPIEEARQQACDAALERVLDILAKYGDDESETYHQIYMLKSGALKSTASGDGK